MKYNSRTARKDNREFNKWFGKRIDVLMQRMEKMRKRKAKYEHELL